MDRGKKPLFTGFAPHTDAAMLSSIFASLFFPWRWTSWFSGDAQTEVQTWIDTTFKTSSTLVDSGRSALYVALKAAGVGNGDTVLVQAYTCSVVINAITRTGAEPIYVDITDTLCMDPHDAGKKVKNSTKAIIIQHTFGAIADIPLLLALAKEHNLVTVEDAAHAFGLKDESGRYLGTIADIGMYSFGSDKCISSVRGGAIVSSNATYMQAIAKEVSSLGRMPLKMLLKHLLHPIFFSIGKPFYFVHHIGKLFLYMARKLRLNADIITGQEKKGNHPQHMPAAFPNALARLLVPQLRTVEQLNAHRSEIAAIYASDLNNKIDQPHRAVQSPLRYILLVDHPDRYVAKAKKRGVLLGDWYRGVVAPTDTQMDAMHYPKGSCPKAEATAKRSLNLPTHRGIRVQDAKVIASIINDTL